MTVKEPEDDLPGWKLGSGVNGICIDLPVGGVEPDEARDGVEPRRW